VVKSKLHPFIFNWFHKHITTSTHVYYSLCVTRFLCNPVPYERGYNFVYSHPGGETNTSCRFGTSIFTDASSVPFVWFTMLLKMLDRSCNKTAGWSNSCDEKMFTCKMTFIFTKKYFSFEKKYWYLVKSLSYKRKIFHNPYENVKCLLKIEND